MNGKSNVREILMLTAAGSCAYKSLLYLKQMKVGKHKNYIFPISEPLLE